MTTVLSEVEPPRDTPGEDRGRGRTRLSSIGHAPSPWRGGLRAARRHSLVVRILRWAAVAFSVVAALIVLSGALLAPAKQALETLSADRVGFDGTKITLESPKISGFQLDRRPYSIKARRGVQDLTQPHMIELLDIDAGIGTSDKKTMQVMASSAKYDSENEQVVLNGNVRIVSKSGYDLSLETAWVDFKAGTLVSDSPVNLRLDGATIRGARMRLDDQSHVVSFDGGVSSTFEPKSSGDADLADPVQ
jgi:lipopolysaccharide export system protein LptC